jgi:hypothetical protein
VRPKLHPVAELCRVARLSGLVPQRFCLLSLSRVLKRLSPVGRLLGLEELLVCGEQLLRPPSASQWLQFLESGKSRVDLLMGHLATRAQDDIECRVDVVVGHASLTPQLSA